MDIFLLLLYFSLFLFAIAKLPFFKNNFISVRKLQIIFSVKVLASFAVYFIYTKYYTIRMEADLFKYFDDGQVIFSSLKNSPLDYLRFITGIDIKSTSLDVYFNKMNFWTRKIDYGVFNDNRTMIRINAVFALFSFGNVLMHCLFAAFLSFMSFYLIYKVLVNYFPAFKTVFIFTVFLMPSALFWTSSLLKECVVMIGVSLFVYSLYKISLQGFTLKFLFVLIAAIFVLASIKIYVFVVLLPAGFVYIILHYFKIFKPILVFTSVFILLFFVLFILESYFGIIPFYETLADKRNDFIMDAVYYAHAKSYVPIGIIDDTPLACFKETPYSLYRAMFLPQFWNINGFLEILPAIENLFLIILIVLAVFFRVQLSYNQNIYVWFVMFFSLFLLWIIGLTTPVVGAIVRYKVPIFPFLYSIFVAIIDWNKIFRRHTYGNNSF